MFLNRGMIEEATSEAEKAGVMAHEIAQVALRHGTAQATKGQKFQIGAIAGQILGRPLTPPLPSAGGGTRGLAHYAVPVKPPFLIVEGGAGRKLTLGASVSLLSDGVLGLEAEVGHTPRVRYAEPALQHQRTAEVRH